MFKQVIIPFPIGFFDSIDKWAKTQGSSGLAYITLEKNKNLEAKGPIGKFLSNEALEALSILSDAKPGDSIFFACGKLKDVEKLLSQARDKLGEELNLIDQNIFEFCWIVDYPMFELDENTNNIIAIINFTFFMSVCLFSP